VVVVEEPEWQLCVVDGLVVVFLVVLVVAGFAVVVVVVVHAGLDVDFVVGLAVVV